MHDTLYFGFTSTLQLTLQTRATLSPAPGCSWVTLITSSGPQSQYRHINILGRPTCRSFTKEMPPASPMRVTALLADAGAAAISELQFMQL